MIATISANTENIDVIKLYSELTDPLAIKMNGNQ